MKDNDSAAANTETAKLGSQMMSRMRDCQNNSELATPSLKEPRGTASELGVDSDGEFTKSSNGGRDVRDTPAAPPPPKLIDPGSFAAAEAGSNPVDKGIQDILEGKDAETPEPSARSLPQAEFRAAPDGPVPTPINVDPADPRELGYPNYNRRAEDGDKTDSDVVYEESGKTLFEKSTGIPFDFEAAYQKAGQELGAKGLELAGKKLGSHALSKAGTWLASEAGGAFLGITFAGSEAGGPLDQLSFEQHRAWKERQVDEEFIQYPQVFCRVWPNDPRCNSPFQLLPYNLPLSKLAPKIGPPVTRP